MDGSKDYRAERFRVPVCSVSLDEGVVNVQAEMPGVAKEGLEVRVEGNELSLFGRPAQARAELLAALESAQAGEDRFEQALALRDLVELARTDGEPEDPVLATRSREMLDAMGVLSGR